jgi:hypothetical protein
MSSSGVWQCVDILLIDILEERTASIRYALRSSETLVNTRSTQHHIPEDDILHSHRCESLKSYNKPNSLII